MSLEPLLLSYGYPIVLLGSFLEGETIMILGGLFARLGYLSLDLVIVFGMCGTLAGDQLYFYLGRRHGKQLLARHPARVARLGRVLDKLERHQNLLILGFRFLYGLRTITPFAIGMSEVSWLRFAVLNLLGAAIWAITFGSAGYFFGKVMETVLGNLEHYELELILAVSACTGLLWLLHRLRNRPGRHNTQHAP